MRHVPGRSHQVAGQRHQRLRGSLRVGPRIAACQSEIRYHDARPVVRGHQHDVGRLEVAVDDGGCVRRIERRRHPFEQRQSLAGAHGPVSAKARLQRLTGK